MPEEAESFLQHIRVGAERAGRSLSDIELQVAGGSVWVADDVAEALKGLRGGVAGRRFHTGR